MILPDKSPEHTGLVLAFRIDDPKQAEALHRYRAAFGAATHLEALDEKTYILHIYPGVCSCGDAA